jgi:hypothetical protein
MTYAIQFTAISRNRKIGPMPVSTTARKTCPPACPLFKKGCYAKGGPLGMLWTALSRARPGSRYALPRGAFGQSLAWQQFVVKVAALPIGTLWRHNQAGDLPGIGDQIDAQALGKLVQANSGRRGFTYTHKPITGPYGRANAKAMASAAAQGFTINLSADNLAEADQLAATGLPTVVVLPREVHGNVALHTPQGRRVVVCPATYRADVTCSTCQLCQRGKRSTIVGFPAHGAAAKTAGEIAKF